MKEAAADSLSGFMNWVERLGTELSQELGQPVTVCAAAEGPEGAGLRCDALELPEARIVLQVREEELAAVLIAGRVIDESQADAETVRELWTGILNSLAGRLGGRATPAAGEPPGQPCELMLGGAAIRMALAAVPPAAAAPVASGEAAAASAPGREGNYDLLMEVELDAMVRFGSREMELKEVLELGPGDVVELDRHVADPVDLIVGDKIVARGEVVLINGNFGLRVTEVAEPMRRLESIRCLW